MTISAPKRAAVRALSDLTVSTDPRETDPAGWILDEIVAAAEHYNGGEKITVETIDSLRKDRIVAGPAGRYRLTEFGQQRLREGL